MQEGIKFQGEREPKLPKEYQKMFLDFVDGFMPVLKRFKITETRMCLYCDSWDAKFYITSLPNHSNLFLATGGSGTAFKFAPGLFLFTF